MATKQEASKQTEYEIEILREENDNWSSEDRRAAMESRSSLGNEQQGCFAIVRSKFCSRR